MSEPVQMISHPFSGGSIKGAIKGVEFFQMSSVMNYNKFYDHRRGTFPTRFFLLLKVYNHHLHITFLTINTTVGGEKYYFWRFHCC